MGKLYIDLRGRDERHDGRLGDPQPPGEDGHDHQEADLQVF